ncbi:MAG TPA: heavy metal-binding domain-containing protein, partial [Pyrinomonadaceae bacterium]|nr:heavy metal-binding domain-containing protein [Pyrinomonadaceae bacterium]
MKHLFNCMILGLLVCPLAFIPTYAQTQTPSKKIRKQQIYSCPMHPEVTSKSKGKCPKCKMDLRRVDQKEATADASNEAGTPTAPAEIVRASDQLSKMHIPDLELLDQNGRKIHFYTDLVKGHTVVINFIFTTCTTICPPLGAT